MPQPLAGHTIGQIGRGLIGLGLMGRPMACNPAKAGSRPAREAGADPARVNAALTGGFADSHIPTYAPGDPR